MLDLDPVNDRCYIDLILKPIRTSICIHSAPLRVIQLGTKGLNELVEVPNLSMEQDELLRLEQDRGSFGVTLGLVLGIERLGDLVQEVEPPRRRLTSWCQGRLLSSSSNTAGGLWAVSERDRCLVISVVGHIGITILEIGDLVIAQITTRNFCLNLVIDFVGSLDFRGALCITSGLPGPYELWE